MKRITLFLMITIIASALAAKEIHSNNGMQEWYPGSIVLKEGETLEGEIKYDLRADAVHLRVNQVIRTFVANQITGFNITQVDVEGKRFFISMPFEATGGYKRPKLFEVIYINEVSLLGREEDAYSTWTTLDPSIDLANSRRRVGRRYSSRYATSNYDYFLSDNKGGITIMKRGVKGVTRAFDNYHKELKTYIRRNKLNIKSVYDMAKIVDYYNSIEKDELLPDKEKH